MKFKIGELAVIGGIALFLLLVQVISLLLVPPLVGYDLRAFGNPESVWNPIYYVVFILLFTMVMLAIIKYKVRWLMQAIMGVAILSTLTYVFFGIAVLVVPSIDPVIAAIVSGLASILLTAIIVFYPEWYVVDVVGVLVAAGASALFGVSLAIMPTLILLALLAVYDYIAVYRTKHMIRLAEGVMDLKIPIMFVMPRRWGYSFARAGGMQKEGEKEAYFMGLGDAVMPTMLAVSANAFLDVPRLLGFINVPALGSVAGTLVSYFALMYVVVKLKKPQAGLPFLCTGSIVGFLLGCLAAGVRPF
ncbi:presenilin family intramembrane aspartyl protease PSH [Methanocella conradii]|uniref:presenilin family intramembrane aspartyl protease PSH n=1 Tax=Methanocella conradii TaxID=1175444 RepID=UPI00157DD4ED|nr:presenilin family intramembrane aspartyl protease PSH [Methanocella conradii]